MSICRSDILSILQDKNISWSELQGSSCLITGATGLIGSMLVRVLKELGNVKIFATVRDKDKAMRMLGDGIEFVIGDVRNPINVQSNIDYIIHCAAITTSKYMVTNPVETMSIAIDGTRNILDLAREKSVRAVLYLSSMEVYGTTDVSQNPMTEEKLGFVALDNLRSSYPESKRICELLCNSYHAQYGVPVKIARLAQTFGAGIPLNDNRVSMQFARAAVLGQNIVLHTAGKSLSNFCYTTDSIRGIFTILLKGENTAYNVCNDTETRSICEIARLVADEIGEGKIQVVFDIPSTNTFGYANDSVMRLISSKLEKLGWTARVDMREAYRRLAAYIRENVVS